MTFLAIQQAVYRRVGLADSPSSGDATRVKQFINLWYRRILAMPGMDQFRDTTLTFATVANQAQYGIPAAINRVRDVYDTTNQRRIFEKTLDWLRTADPGLSSTSAVQQFWIPIQGWGAVQQPIAVAGKPLYVVSTSASDTTQKAYVETTRLTGIRSGLAVSAGSSLNGTTRVQIGTLSTHIEVVKFFLDAVGVGAIQLYDASSAGNLISQIDIGKTNARYFMLQLYPTPTAAVTLSVDCQRAIEDLSKDTEEPLFPEDYHLALIEGATYEEWRKRNDGRMAGARTEAERLLSDLRISVYGNPDQIMVQRGPRAQPERTSRLGGWYPSGS